MRQFSHLYFRALPLHHPNIVDLPLQIARGPVFLLMSLSFPAISRHLPSSLSSSPFISPSFPVHFPFSSASLRCPRCARRASVAHGARSAHIAHTCPLPTFRIAHARIALIAHRQALPTKHAHADIGQFLWPQRTLLHRKLPCGPMRAMCALCAIRAAWAKEQEQRVNCAMTAARNAGNGAMCVMRATPASWARQPESTGIPPFAGVLFRGDSSVCSETSATHVSSAQVTVEKANLGKRRGVHGMADARRDRD